ncbi:hypothetical protein LWT81_22350, partial [Enterobacter hormaechei]|nr:hypothetical protein [Enterobacter hormaechei]
MSHRPPLSTLTPAELRRRLHSPHGLRLQLGRFVAGIRSNFDSVADGLQALYADYPVAADDDFCDYPVEVRSSGLRRYLRPQAIF